MARKTPIPITSLCVSSRIFYLSVVVLVITVKQVASQSVDDRNNTLLRKYCRPYKPLNEEFYKNNLDTVFSRIRAQLSDQDGYYGFARETDNGEFVYAFAFCREYLSRSECLACFDSAVKEAKSCGNTDGGNVIYDDCSIRYENFDITFGGTDVDDIALPSSLCRNDSTSQPTSTFNKVVARLLSDIRVTTPRTSNFYVVSTTQVSTDNETVYAIAQCIKNTSQANCQRCLNTAYNNLLGCLPNKEGRAIDFFCFMRYSNTPFFHKNQTTDIIPFLKEGNTSKSVMIAGVCGSVGLILLMLVLWLWYRKLKRGRTTEEVETGRQFNKGYNYEQLRLATNNFGDKYRIGKGGFGEVFKAVMDNGDVVAVKRLHDSYDIGKLEFENEVKLISNVQHRNLVRQLGWCVKGPKLLLVLEYIPQGSLDNFLWGERKGTLNWEKRFDIIFGIARGLAHLHDELHVKIIHRDIKLKNILLDDDYIPKICDFGLARLQSDDKTHTSTKLVGTLGYMAPEYATMGHLSEKVDVYAFGIVILEIVSGRRCSDENFNGPNTSHLLEHAWELYEKGMHVELIDQSLDMEEYRNANVMKTIEIALMCTQATASSRPSMSEIISMLSSELTPEPGKLIKPSFVINPRRVIRIGEKGS